MKRTNIFFPTPMLKALRTLAVKTGLSVAEHVRRAVTNYLDKQK